MDFNKGQLLAINHFTGPAMVLAGPGSGKTTVIVKRIEQLIRMQGITPSNILVITFTNAAALQMQERFEKCFNNAPVRFGTFHSFFFSVLKHAYHYNASSILRNDTKKQILTTLFYSEKLEIEQKEDFLGKIEGEISRVKSEGIPLENYYPVCTSKEVFMRFYRGYERELHARGMLDFDDMMSYCHELFEKRKDILEMWHRQYSYIMVDEFQDISKLQYEIVKMLAAPSNNLFIVGDDDQSIYGFRGSKPEFMLNFEKDFPGTKRILLNVNYRCDENITLLSDRIIRFNKQRFKKNLESHKAARYPVNIVKCKDIRTENNFILKKIKEYCERGISVEDMAVIFRTNTQPAALVGKLMEENIPFIMKDRVPNLFDHWIAKDLKAYIEIAEGDRSQKNFLRIMNRPLRYISRDSLGYGSVDLIKVEDYYSDKKWMAERICRLSRDIDFLKDLTPYGGLSFIKKGIGYEGFIREYAAEHSVSEEELFLTLDEIMESAKDKKTYKEWFEYMDEYKKLLENEERKQKQEKQGISLVTMHSAKGLEYETVFLIDANEGVTPFHKAIEDADIEEERRLFYVAMTRAKSHLNISYVEERFGKRMSESRFISELRNAEGKDKAYVELEYKPDDNMK